MSPLADLVDAVVDRLMTELPAVPTVAPYPRLRKKLAAPALLLEIATADGAPDPGTGELCLTVRLELRAVCDRAPAAAGASPERDALELAAAAAQVIYAAGRFGLAVGPARDLRLEPDQFKPDLATYAVWLVEWTHEVRLGSSVWDGAGVIPTEVYAGLAPEVGPPHLGDYVEVTG